MVLRAIDKRTINSQIFTILDLRNKQTQNTHKIFEPRRTLRIVSIQKWVGKPTDGGAPESSWVKEQKTASGEF